MIEQRDRQPQAGADEVDVRPDQVQADAEHQAADDGAERGVDPAEDGRREGVDQHRLHHVRVEEDGRRRQHPGGGAEHRGEPPADREHPADADADEPARFGVERGRPQRQADLRELEERPQERDHHEHDQERADVLLRDRDAADLPGVVRERARERAHLGRPDQAGEAVEDQDEADRDDHRRQQRRPLDRADDDALDAEAERRRRPRA